MLELHHCRVIDWSPSPVVALATSVDGTVIAAARDSGAIEVWIVAPGAVGWHRQLVFPGKQDATISSLIWCHSGSSRKGRLFSGGLDGVITEWDLKTLIPKGLVDSHGGSVWHLAAEPSRRGAQTRGNAVLQASGQNDGSESDVDSDVESTSGSDDEEEEQEAFIEQRVAVGCDDGCVRLFVVTDSENGMQYRRTLPRVKGRILSVAWSMDGLKVYAGGSDGCIRCWEVGTMRELYRMTVGTGGLGGGSEVCVWSLLVLADGIIVSGDSSGATQFWEGRHGTLLQAHKHHKADVLALAAGPSHREIFAAGADGQVSLYRLLSQSNRSSGASDISVRSGERWVFVGSKRAHTHDVRALTVACPLTIEEGERKEIEHRKKARRQKPGQKGMDYSKWAVAGTPMLVSGGNDAKLFTFPANSFLNFHPYDICTAPERPFIQVVYSPSGVVLIMSQHTNHIDLWRVNSTSTPSQGGKSNGNGHGIESRLKHSVLGRRKRDVSNGVEENGPALVNGNGCGEGVEQMKRLKGSSPKSSKSKPVTPSMRFGKVKALQPEHVVRIKSKERDHIACSAISQNGAFIAFSCFSKTRLFQLEEKRSTGSISKAWAVRKVKLPQNLPTAHRLAFSSDSTQLILAGPEGLILVIDIHAGNVMHKFDTFAGPADEVDAPVTIMSTSSDGQWLAATTSSGNIHIYNLETLRHHWSIPVLDGACVTAAVFHAGSNVLVVGTAANQLHVLDIEAKMLGNWSKKYGSQLPREFLEFPGGLAGLSMPPSMDSTSLIVYSSRAMCHVDFNKPVRDVTMAEAYKASVHASPMKGAETADGPGKPKMVNGSRGAASKNSNRAEKNFVIAPFEEPVLFVGHVSDNQVLVVEKPWIEVLRQMPAPVFRHLYGT